MKPERLWQLDPESRFLDELKIFVPQDRDFKGYVRIKKGTQVDKDKLIKVKPLFSWYVKIVLIKEENCIRYVISNLMSNFSLNFAAMFRDSLLKIKQFLLIFQILRKTQQYRALELLIWITAPHTKQNL